MAAVRFSAVTRFETLSEAARESLERFGVPGASVGVYHEGAEEAAGFGSRA